MGKNQEKDELEGVEAIPREQAEKEMQSAVEKLHSRQGSSKKASHSGKHEATENDELADVETIPRQQAEKEIHDAVSKVKKDKDKDKKKG